jgi:hypothetical protein
MNALANVSSSTPDGLPSNGSFLLTKLSTEFLLELLIFSFPEIRFDYSQDFYIFIELFFHILHCLSYYIELLLCILLELIQVFIHGLFSLVDHFYDHCFEFLFWLLSEHSTNWATPPDLEFFGISLTWLSLDSIDVELLTLGGVMFHYFLITFTSLLRFIHLKPSL